MSSTACTSHIGLEQNGQTSAHSAYMWIKRAIATGRFAQGDVINQVQISEDLSVSRTPIREAIRMLQAEGWVESEPNKRVRVASVSPADIEQVYAMRVSMESMAIGLAVPRMQDGDIAALRQLLDEMQGFAEAHDYVGWDAPHSAFHRLLVKDAGHQIVAMCANLAQTSSRYRSLYMTSVPTARWQSHRDHVSIVEACEERDAQAASRELAHHLARTAIYLLSLLDPGRDPYPVRFAVNHVTAPTPLP